MTRKNNPINDIVNQVGRWLGGRGPGTNPQVQAAMQATRAVGKVVDTATGGFGQALLSDAQRMAMSGSSTPSALYKTTAVNLGAAAAGVGAAKVAGKTVSQLAKTRNRNTQYLFHGSSRQGLSSINPTPSYMKNLNLPNRAYATSDIRKAESFADIATRKPDALPSVYVVASKKKNIKSVAQTAYSNEALAGADSFVTNKPMRVVAEIKTPRYPQTLENLEELAKTAIKTDRERKLLSRKRIIKYK